MRLSEHQRREQEFHDEYASKFNINKKIDFTCVDGPRSGEERRPWNPYWAIIERVLNEYEDRGSRPRILDFGCGSGYYSAIFARIGYNVVAFDISEKSVEFARRQGQAVGYGDDIVVSVGTGERLPYRDETFDVICGIDILHHLDSIPAAMLECGRVLKPGGVMFFKEFFEADIFDRIRNSAVVRAVAPNTADSERYVTEDEKKLDSDSLGAISSLFPSVTITYFRMLSRLDNIGLISDWLKPAEAFLAKKAWANKVDRWLIDRLPFVRRYCGEGIVCIRKE